MDTATIRSQKITKQHLSEDPAQHPLDKEKKIEHPQSKQFKATVVLK